MNRQRDIDRTLEAWFLDGPSVMPDRLFDAVFDQVERTPQRRLAHLLRFAEMNPRIRLFTVLAAAVLVVVAAIAVIGGGSQGPVKAPPSPSPQSTAAAAVPTELHSTWMGGPRVVPGIAAEAGTQVVFNAGRFWMTQSNLGNSFELLSDARATGADRIELTATGATGNCASGDVGVYTWSQSASGETLALAAVNDTCGTRLAALPGTYWRSDCLSQTYRCQGILDAGTYDSQFIEPRGAGESAQPPFGAVRYTVPEGWANADDRPSTFSLLPRREYETYDPTTCGEVCPDAIMLLARASAAEQGDTCESRAEPGVGRTATDLVAWLTSRPGLVTSTEPVTVGGQTATAIDIAVADSWTGTCPAEPPLVGVPLLTEIGGWHWAIFSGDRYRVIPLDLGNGDTVVILVDTREASTFDAFIDEAMPVIATFEFE